MRKLVFILIGFIAVITFIRAFDNSTVYLPSEINSAGINPPVLFYVPAALE